MDLRPFLDSANLFYRRLLAGVIDLFWLGGLAAFYLGTPIFTGLAYNLWEPSNLNGTTDAGILIDQITQTVGVLTLVNVFFCHPALAMTRLREGTPGQILTGTKVVAQDGSRLRFGRALIVLAGSYTIFVLVLNIAAVVASSAANFIPALGYAALRELVNWSLVAVTFAIALVSERRQDLYEIISRRLFVINPDAQSLKERLLLLLPSIKRLWRPAQKATILEKCAAGTISASIIIGTVSGIALILLGGSIIFAIFETETGMGQLAHKQEKSAADHFASALRVCPGAANVYNQLFLYSEGRAPEQLLAVDRLIALRGEAHDYLTRARLEAREHMVSQASLDYKQALACQKNPLNKEERAEVTVELSILEFKAIQL